MPSIRPFKGIRYPYSTREELGRVMTPPYDIIDELAQKTYYQVHPHNIIRLELSESLPGDCKCSNRYTRALQTYEDWLAKGVLVRDDEPCLYLYRQGFSHEGLALERWAFFASVEVTPYASKQVYPHEDTLPKPLEDRLQLLRTLKVNVSPIFTLYPDESQEVIPYLRSVAPDEPTASAVDLEGNEHSLWALPGTLTGHAEAFLQDVPLFIADGHHRYETALRYRQEQPGAFSDRVLMGLVNLFDPSLVVLPTHRLVRGIPPAIAGELREGNIRGFQHRPLASLEGLLEALDDHGEPAFGLYMAGRFGLFTLTGDGSNAMLAARPQRSSYWHSLDVSALQTLVVEPSFQGAEIAYTRDTRFALGQVDGEKWDAAFFVRASQVDTMKEIALAGDRMPQKSTYFFPKLPTGLVLHPLA